MIILITNDDGIDAPGISALESALKDHEVWTVAPDQEQSAQSHSITLRTPVRFNRKGERRFACSGKPADCVIYSLLGAIPVRPDIVLSGINFGPNLGTDLIYSGTAAAARQAALMGVPGVAASLITGKGPHRFSVAAELIAENVEFFTALWDDSHFINLNFPEDVHENSRFQLSMPARRKYLDELQEFTAPDGSVYYMIKGTGVEATDQNTSDFSAVSNGNVAISPISLLPSVSPVYDLYLESFSEVIND